MRHCKVVFMACALALVWGCSQQQPITDSTKNEQKEQPQQTSSINRQKNEQNEIWKLAAQGKLKGVDLSVKSTKSEIIKKYGKPLENTDFNLGMMALYLNFQITSSLKMVKTKNW
ncbi:hypothetical protein QJ48_07605 [Paenibacillus sp. A3]|uniref:hypothetical protein n=1 Tax=Paenibacillus sp. A3 TaxID=1337054 RepID=UPI0006D57619|nr:hypothetical protein [Paenibacillus sp. A3]KPV60066.1 hypothetical protein QJ48_07605 [Paenibacillus sp. A3]